ncbi:hypothetical protein FACS189499_09000 [Clostridia bacterium]|nr:hypothetical protein FACS189499_09000 [Clostridia bacterium]
MSKTVKDFYNELQNHTDFIEKNKDIKDEAEYTKAVVEYANAKGYSFTADELKAHVSEKKELNKDDLKAVAGGGTCACAVGGGGSDSDGNGGHCTCVMGGSGGPGNSCICVVAGGGGFNERSLF